MSKNNRRVMARIYVPYMRVAIDDTIEQRRVLLYP